MRHPDSLVEAAAAPRRKSAGLMPTAEWRRKQREGARSTIPGASRVAAVGAHACHVGSASTNRAARFQPGLTQAQRHAVPSRRATSVPNVWEVSRARTYK